MGKNQAQTEIQLECSNTEGYYESGSQVTYLGRKAKCLVTGQRQVLSQSIKENKTRVNVVMAVCWEYLVRRLISS